MVKAYPAFRPIHKFYLQYTVLVRFSSPKCTKFKVIRGCARGPTVGAYNAPQPKPSSWWDGGSLPLPKKNPSSALGPWFRIHHTHIFYRTMHYSAKHGIAITDLLRLPLPTTAVRDTSSQKFNRCYLRNGHMAGNLQGAAKK